MEHPSWGTLSELKTETDFQNIAHPLAASPSSPDIAEQGQSSHLPCKQRYAVVVCLEGRRSRNDWTDWGPSPGTQVFLTCVVALLVGERDVLDHFL